MISEKQHSKYRTAIAALDDYGFHSLFFMHPPLLLRKSIIGVLIHICYHISMKSKPKFEFYVRPNGHSEFVDFLQTLPLKDKEKLLAIINLVQENGLAIAQRMKWVKKIDGDIYEVRSQVASNIQRALYFDVSGNKYVITHGFTKKTPKTPASEIHHAKMLKKEYEESDQHGNN